MSSPRLCSRQDPRHEPENGQPHAESCAIKDRNSVKTSQISVNTGQIIPVFTFVWDDELQSKREKIGMGSTPTFGLPAVLMPSKHLARIHDEATTSDYGSDTGVQHHLAPGADQYDEDHNG